ncbi:hypothetical protein Tco_1563209 [Tanacetum coccineum]
MQEGGLAPNILNLNQFKTTEEGPSTLEEAKLQMEEINRLDDLRAKKKKSKKTLQRVLTPHELKAQEEDKDDDSLTENYLGMRSNVKKVKHGREKSLDSSEESEEKRYAGEGGREKKRLQRKKLRFPMLLHAQRDAQTSGCFTPNGRKELKGLRLPMGQSCI